MSEIEWGLNLRGAISNAPKPDDAEIDLVKARAQFERDVKNANAIYSNNPPSQISIQNNMDILLNHRSWALFWSKRHPKPAEREKAAHAFRTLDAAVQRVTQRARSILLRQVQQ